MIGNLFDVIIIIFLFALFGLLHSLLASIKIKTYFAKRFGNIIAFYRFIYVLISFLSLYLVYQLSPNDHVIVYDLPYPFDFLILIPQFLSLAGFLWAFKYFSLGEFIGINQILRWKSNDYNASELDEEVTLKIGGPYKFCRHPLYFFSILFLIFRPEMNLTYLTFLFCITAYFYIGSIYEEKKLIEKFGTQYELYKRQVPRIFPVKFSLYKKR